MAVGRMGREEEGKGEGEEKEGSEMTCDQAKETKLI